MGAEIGFRIKNFGRLIIPMTLAVPHGPLREKKQDKQTKVLIRKR